MKVFLDFVGCRLNQSEIDKWGNQLRQLGHTLVDNAKDAELVVLNTCAVTHKAAADSRQKIRNAAKDHPATIVTGCWSELEPDQAAGLPGVQQVVLNAEKDTWVQTWLGLIDPLPELETRLPLPGELARSRTFIKTQDGCNNACSFCVTQIARGPSRSIAPQTILADIRAAIAGGVKEVVLSGVQLGAWGKELTPRQSLADIVRSILAETSIQRLRLSSIEPWDVDEKLIELWQDPRLCRHFHIPLQSGCQATLKRMARPTSLDAFTRLLEQIKHNIPQAAVSTDIIVGFPGETEHEFQESLAYINALQLAGGHVFSYSPRPGTRAATMPDQVAPAHKKERSRSMRHALAAAGLNFRRSLLGQTLPVLWETSIAQPDGRFLLQGLTDNYIRTSAMYERDRWNEVDQVRLSQVTPSGAKGEIQS